MVPQTAWLDLKFTFDLPIGTFPALLEQLRVKRGGRLQDFRAKDFSQEISAIHTSWKE